MWDKVWDMLPFFKQMRLIWDIVRRFGFTNVCCEFKL